jgi:low affinity Fe/Cu permease
MLNRKPQEGEMNDLFHKLARVTSNVVGSPIAFIVAVAMILLWLVAGPMFGFSDTWQLVINTATTIVTFLIVFLIQNTQNRDAKALHLKLDELLRGVKGARTGLVNLEELSDEELESLHQEFERLRSKCNGSGSAKGTSLSGNAERIRSHGTETPEQR